MPAEAKPEERWVLVYRPGMVTTQQLKSLSCETLLGMLAGTIGWEWDD
jgi:hypothetical protein